MSSLFVKEAFTFRNPDGSLIDVLGWGDQHYAVFESLDGFTVIKDPNTGYYHYARLSDDRSELLPTGMRVGAGDPRSLGLEPHLRANPQAIRESVRRATDATGKQRWEVRRERRRAALQRTLEAEGPQPAPPSEPRTGTYVGLCVLIQFPDVAGTITREEVSDFCNQQGYHGYGNNGSVYDYYFDNSGGRLEYTNVVTSYYTAQQNRSYYTDESVAQPTRARELIKEALDNLKSQNFNFSQLSSDSEGYVYALNVFYAGARVNNWAQGLWPHSSTLPTYNAGSGKTFCDYQITNMGSQLTLRTFCHENGHMLCDFPDLYDYGYQSWGVGNFCLMAGGGSNTNPVEINAYLKYQAGWASQVIPLTPGFASASAGQNDFFIHSNPANSTEYFIIQNRQRQGRDASLPSAGLAIWHVDELGSNNDEQMSPSQHYECALEQADGHFDLEKNINLGDSADLFASPQATQFAYDTSPNANWWNSVASGVDLSQISPPAETMTFVQAGFRRQGDSDNQAGVVREIAMAKHQMQQIVTAVQTESSTLELISWRVNSDGSVSRTGDSSGQAGAASYIDIAGSSSIAGGSRYVTACRTGSGTLELISWDISDDGMTIARAGDSNAQAGVASHIKIVMLSESLFVTACRTASGTLKLISWRLNPNGSITRCPGGGGDAEAVSEIALTAIPSGDGGGRVITSVRAGNGHLLLIVWAVSPSGVITRLGNSGTQAGEASMIRSVLDNYGHVVTSVCAGNGSLLLITWEIADDGNTVRRLSDSSNKAGEIGNNALMAHPNGVVSAVRSGEGTLLLIDWEVGPLGEINRVFDSHGQAGEASLITLCEQSLDGEFPIVTAVRAGNGSLLLITWSEHGV